MSGGLWGTIPIAASEAAHAWDALWYFLFAVCVVFFVIVVVPMVWFAIAYRDKPGRRASGPSHNLPLEVIWTAIPTVIVMVIFVWGWLVYKKMELDIPPDAMEVHVVAQRWSWSFQYDDGRITTNQLFVPVNKPVKLILTSKREDVLHSFFVPNFRVKKDTVPGMYTTTWFRAQIVGQHQIFCTEYCGTGHSAMLAKVVVLDEENWKLWKWGKDVELPPAIGLGSYQLPTTAASLDATSTLASNKQGTVSLSKEGEKLFQTRGCVACHSGAAGSIGPDLHGVFGHEVELTDGSKVLVDENYIRESILQPQKKVVKGYEGVLMPPYMGQFTDMELNALVSYLKELK